jgi:SAM-dependent methyltransferase
MAGAFFRENDIRSGDFGKFIDACRVKDIKRFFLDSKGRPLKKYFSCCACPGCGKKGNPLYFMKEKFIFRLCKKCGTLYISPRPKLKRLSDYYADAESIRIFTREVLEKTAAVRKEKIFLPRAERLCRYLKNFKAGKQLLVEIGGGNGIFLELLKERKLGFGEYLNIEPSGEGARLSRARGIKTLNCLAEETRGLQADCICAFELIEHLFDPLAFCRQVRSLLKPGGVFILTTPNINGFDLLLLGKDSYNISGPNHLNYFNPESIAILLKRSGFKVVALETPGVLDVDIVYNRVKGGYKLNDRFVLSLLNKGDSLRDKLQLFLQDNLLSSNMLVVARKSC